jgi:sodium transport system permease protein
MSIPNRTDSACSRIGVIALKEIVDLLRDRRTMIVTVITAMAAGPVLMLLVINLIAGQANKARDLRLPIIGATHAPALVAFLQRQQVAILEPPADFESKIKSGDLDIVLEIDAAFAARVAKGEPGVVHLIYDRSRDRALPTIYELEKLLRAYNREWGSGRLLLRGIGEAVANPIAIEVRDLSTPQSSGALVLFLIAYYGLFAAVMGGMAAAVDTIAGERERTSLEPLLTTSVRPLELAAGKLASVIVLNACTVTLTLTGFYLILGFAPLPAVGIPFLFGLSELMKFLLVLAPLILLMPSVFLYLGARARSYKEAQSNVALLFFVASLAPIVQMFLQKKEPAWLSWVPVSGQYGLLSRVLRGEALPMEELLQSYAIPAMLTVVALLSVARLFARESALAANP